MTGQMDRKPAVVTRAEDVDIGWLQRQLDARGLQCDVRALSVVPVGTGQLGDTIRIVVDYGALAGPPSFIAKFASANPDSRALASAWRLYEREVRFYSELAPSSRIATPSCYGAELDEAGNFVLLMSDCTPARPGDQIAGISHDLARCAMREAARLHAAFWDCGDDPAFAWLETEPMAQPFYGPEVLRGAWPAFLDRYRDVLTDDMIRVCGRLAERYEAFSAPLARPRCVTHNDFRPDNMLFGDDGALTVVDWQSAALGFNAVDVAYLIGGAFSPDARRAAENDLLGTYHDELLRQGVRDYSRAALDEDYRHFSFAGINVAVGAAMMVQRTERGDRMFLTMLDRHVSHVIDAGALQILDERQMV